MTRQFVCRIFMPILLAASASTPLSAQTPSLADILEEQRTLAGRISTGEIPLTPRERAQVQRAQDAVFAATDGKPSIDAMSIAEQVRMRNALQQVESLVAGGHRARQDVDICRRERATGSGMQATRCGTAGERAEMREGARGYLEKRRICVPPGCG